MLLVLVITMLVLTPILLVCCSKPDIRTATQDQLQAEILGIGEIKSELIVSYLESNKNATIEDLERIEGIGEVLIEKIKKRWK